MKILVTGANGLLGQHLIKLLLEDRHQVLATGRGPSRLDIYERDLYSYEETDICDWFAVRKLIKNGMPELVIHAAAMTQVDQCELNQASSFEANVRGTANILMHAKNLCRFFVYVSTDFVFDGKKGNYKEEDDLNPVNWYGLTKIRAEELVRRNSIPYAIVRTCLVYGNPLKGTRNNIISWTKENLEVGKRIKVVDDQLRTPTFVRDLARGILLLCNKKLPGIFHISGEEALTPYEMALRTAKYFQYDERLIERVNAEIFSQPARRPPKTGFVISLAKRELGYAPINFEMGLKAMYSTSEKPEN